MRGRRRRRRGDDGQPAAGRCADGEQRHRVRSRGRRAHVWVSHQAPHTIHAGYAPMLGLEAGEAARRLPVGGRWVRSEGRRLRRAPRRRQAALDARPAGQVGRDPLGGHGVAGPRPRLRHDRPARREQRRQDRRARRRGAGRGGCLPGDRRHPADAHADDVGRRLRGPEGPLRRQDGAHEQHDDRRLPRCRAARRRRS